MMKKYSYIEIETGKNHVTIWLNRPEKHNALNPVLMKELMDAVTFFEANEDIRAIVFRGRGKSFCAGADLNWMKAASSLSKSENLTDSIFLSDFFKTIHQCRKVTIAITHGNVFGGGNGLSAVCDMAYGLDKGVFSLSETRLGLIAATITPYMMEKMQSSAYKELIYTARRFSGREATELGLLNKAFMNFDELEAYLQMVLHDISKAGPRALEGSKSLINSLNDPRKAAASRQAIPSILADVRVGSEAKEGFQAFLEKRKPNWNREV